MIFRSYLLIGSLLLLSTIFIFSNHVNAEPGGDGGSATSTPPVSTRFLIGDRVYPIDEIGIRGSATLQSNIIGTQASGTLATVIENPISADGYIWWNLDYDTGTDGWVREYILKNSSTSSPQAQQRYSPSGEVKITSSPAERSNISVSGSRVVWQDSRNGNPDIYTYNLSSGTERQVTGLSVTEIQPAISGDRVVYLRREPDPNNAGYDTTKVYLFDLAANFERSIAQNGKFQSQPAISGNHAAYIETLAGERTVYLYNLNTDTREAVSIGNNISDLGMAGNYLVWTDSLDGTSKVSIYDMQSRSLSHITSDAKEEISPAISSSGKIAFAGRRAGGAKDYHVYLYDIQTGESKYLTGYSGVKPTDIAISNNHVSWSQDGELFIYNINTSARSKLTQLSGFRKQLSLSDYGLVWLDSRSGNGEDVYIWNIQ